MYKFLKRYINTVIIIISIIIFFLLNNYNFSIQKIDSREGLISNQYQTKIEQENTSINNTTKEVEKNAVYQIKENVQEVKKTQNTKEQWQIEIPTINLKAEIAEGTTKEIMNEFVGHFEETTKDIGNIGLAAHNRGYNVNYFENLKKLKKGDEIIYRFNGKQRRYEIQIHKIIKDTDWYLLENTKDNRITLITCVENKPEYRRCIQATEKKE